jgi:hypothetical protein
MNRTRFFASDSPQSVDAVVSGEADIAICNPGGVLGMALRGSGPFKNAYPLRSIMVLPAIIRWMKPRCGSGLLSKRFCRPLRNVRNLPRTIDHRTNRAHCRIGLRKPHLL